MTEFTSVGQDFASNSIVEWNKKEEEEQNDEHNAT